LLHPADREQIIKRGEQTVPNAVFALASVARTVVHWNFRDGKALNFEESPHKPVHSFEKFEVLDALALEGAVATPSVGNVIAGKSVAHPVGNSGRADANKIVTVLSRFHACPANAVELLQRLQ